MPPGAGNIRQPYTVQKPEHVLKRVNELIASATGNGEKEKSFALDQLHHVISNSKRKQWQKVHELIMKRHLELCVDLKDARLAKDGLHQYRNMVLNLDPQSLEVVIVHLVELSEARASLARKAADSVALAAAAKVSDLDQEETPESLMLSTMTEDGAKERTDKEVVVPWLRFLWEIYRAVLELLHKNSKLDKVYHKTCEKAFRFCQDYSRKFEFRKLCEMLRMHLNNVQKLAGQSNKQNKPVWEWTTELIELFLQTRFIQLEVSTALELWNEGFRTVEEIYSIIQLGKKSPKPRLLSVYYEKLTRVFWVSGNFLFHAYSWHRYYTLSCECRKDMKPEERSAHANTVLLATLCIPDDSPTPSIGPIGATVDEEGTIPDKDTQIAVLLDFNPRPSRQSLLAEIINGGILEDVSSSVRSLYNALEGSFRPLSLVKELVPILDSLSSSTTQSIYGDQLKRVIIIRAVQQLSKVYSSIKLDFLKKLLAGLNMPFFEIERLLLKAITRKQVQLRLDHSSGCLKFGSEVSSGAAIDDHLAQLGNNLKQFMNVAQPVSGVTESQSEDSRHEYLQKVAVAIREGAYSACGLSTLDRKMLIERRKEERERLQQDRIRDEDNRRKNDEQQRLIDEQQRLQAEEDARNKAKLAKLQYQLNVSKTKNSLAALGKVVEESVLLELDDAALQKLLLETQLESQRAKEEEQKKNVDAAKKLDYSVRALRIECAPLVRQKCQEIYDADKQLYDERVAAARAAHRDNYDCTVAISTLMSRMTGACRPFEDSLLGSQKSVYEKQSAKARNKAFAELRDRRIANARLRLREEYDRIAREEEEAREIAEKEEADRLMAEQHEKLRRTQKAELEAELERERLEAEAQREKAEAAAQVPSGARDTEMFRPSRNAGEINAPPGSAEKWGNRNSGGDLDRGFGGDRDRERGTGGDWGRGAGGDRRGFGGDQDRDRGFGGDRDRERGTGGDWGRGAGGDRNRDRGFGGDRDRERGAGGDWGRGAGGGENKTDKNVGFGSERSSGSDWKRSDRSSSSRGAESGWRK